MPTSTRRNTAGTVATVVLSLLVAGCSGEAAPPGTNATPQQTSTSTPAPTPTKTGPGPMTAPELAWLAAVRGRPSVWAIAGRTVLRIVDVLPFLYLVGFLTMLATGSRRQRIGDLAAGTVVARPQPIRPRSLALAPLVLVLLAVIGLVGYRANWPDTTFTVTTPAPALTTPVPTTPMPTPTPTGPGPLTTEEKAWLAAIPTFMKKVERAFGQDNLYLTPRKLREFAALYRECRADLARGLPSERLRSAYRLVLRACAEYEKGAKCFASAAGIDLPLLGSAADRAQHRAIDCGFAADRKGGDWLAEAANAG